MLFHTMGLVRYPAVFSGRPFSTLRRIRVYYAAQLGLLLLQPRLPTMLLQRLRGEVTIKRISR